MIRTLYKHFIIIIALIVFIVFGLILYTRFYKSNRELFVTKPKLFIYWEQGWDDAPYICKMCLKSWEKYNQNHFDIIALDNKNIKNYLSNDVLNITNRIKLNKSKTASSDLLRVNLLANHGGFWVDATQMCTTPILKYYDRIQTKYDFWFPFDFDSKIHTYNFIFNKKGNPIFKKVSLTMNHHFVNLTDNEIQQIDYLYIGKLMFREFDKHIDWNVIKQKQLLKTSNNKKMGHKVIANSSSLMLQPINTELMQQLENKFFIKLTSKHGISDYKRFDKGTVIEYLINKHSV